MLYNNDVLGFWEGILKMCLGAAFLGAGGFWGDAFKLKSGSLQETLAMQETFSPSPLFETKH